MDGRAEKPVRWVGRSLADLRAFSSRARQVAGFQLWRVQQGLEPNDWKPMSSTGQGVKELRLRTGKEHRVIYIATFPEAIYVLHAFEKRSRKTARADLRTARERLGALAEARTRGQLP